MTDSPEAVIARQLMNNFTSGDANRIAGYVASALRVARYAIVPVETLVKARTAVAFLGSAVKSGEKFTAHAHDVHHEAVSKINDALAAAEES